MAALEFWVPGVARPKGSVDVGAQGQVLHTPASKDRAGLIKRAARTAMVEYGWKRVDPPLGIEVTHIAWLPCAGGAIMATGTGSGDLDKLERNLWDALTEAGVWGDDVQVIDVQARKHVADGPFGEYIAVRTVSAMRALAHKQRDAMIASTAVARAVGVSPTPRGF